MLNQEIPDLLALGLLTEDEAQEAMAWAISYEAWCQMPEELHLRLWYGFNLMLLDEEEATMH